MPDTYVVKLTKQYMSEVKQFNFTINHTVVRFDVVSLFAKVPPAEAVDITIEEMLNRSIANDDEAIPPI